MTSWRTAAVSLLSFSSGLPFGLVMIAVPDWMASSGVSISVVGRIALYRAALFTSGGLAITLAAAWSWPAVNACLAFVYLLALLVTWHAPEPERDVPAPTSLRNAVWEPFLGFLARHRALEILAFV